MLIEEPRHFKVFSNNSSKKVETVQNYSTNGNNYYCYPITERVGASEKKKRERLDPRVQQAILENAAVNELQNRVSYHNAYTFRYNPKLKLVPLEEEDAE
jgi:hypothetical protein